MKILTVNFLSCAVKSCRSSPAAFPLHFKDAEIEQSTIAFNVEFVKNILPRIDWAAMIATATELGLSSLPDEKPDCLVDGDTSLVNGDTYFRKLHELLIETEVIEGSLVCHNCGHEYKIKEGIANFLLPGHLGTDISLIHCGLSNLFQQFDRDYFASFTFSTHISMLPIKPASLCFRRKPISTILMPPTDRMDDAIIEVTDFEPSTNINIKLTLLGKLNHGAIYFDGGIVFAAPSSACRARLIGQ